MTTAFITHQDCTLHNMGPEHPESPIRLAAIRKVLEKHRPAAGTGAD